MVVDMQTVPVTTTAKPALVLNRRQLDALRKANGIETEAELARIIGVRPETLWRATKGEPISGIFAASVKIAFPHASLDSLFSAVSERALAS